MPGDPAAYVIRIGSDTMAIERFVRTDQMLVGQVSVRSQPTIRYRAHIGSNFAIDSMEIETLLSGAAPGSRSSQEAHVVFRGDSVFIAVTGGATHRFASQPGVLPILNNSFALLELYAQRARAEHDSANIAAFVLNGGVTIATTIRPLAPDSLLLTVGGQATHLRVNAVGRILGAAVPVARVSVSRIAGDAASRLTLGATDYSAPPGAPYTARDVQLTTPGGITLGGTLTMPSNTTGKVPAVVTITGSGQQDRDEFVAVVGNYRPFRQVADTLGRRGIAVLRLDDRGIGASGGEIGTSADYADDIRAALAWLRTQPGIDGNRLALLGHSEGGLIAPMVAATDSRLKGIVLWAGPSQTGRQIVTYQNRQAIDLDTTIAPTSRDSMYQRAKQQTDSAAATNVWLNFFLQHDPLVIASQVTAVPVLILQGGTDHQITPEQAPVLEQAFKAAGNPSVTMHIFPGLNHLFIADPSGLPSNYGRLSESKVTSQVMGITADWLAERLGG